MPSPRLAVAIAAVCCLAMLAGAAEAGTAGRRLAQDGGPTPPPLSAAPAPAPAQSSSDPPPAPAAALRTPGLPSQAELTGMLAALAGVQSFGASKLGAELDVTCSPGKLTPPRRAPAVLQWPSARAALVTAVCVKNDTKAEGDPPCTGAVTASQTVPAYALPPRWEPATFVTPACTAGVALPFPGAPPTPPGGDGGSEFNLLPPTVLECASLADLASVGTAWLGKGRKKAGGCRVSGPLVDPEAAVAAALAKLEEAKGVLGLA
jgi:hypothetical protein